MRAGTKSMAGKTTEGLARGVSKRALAAGAGGILRTGVYYLTKSRIYKPFIFVWQIIKINPT
jgi:hypothetical protein